MYRAFRYIVFASLVICNAVSTTSAIWNLSLVQAAGREFVAATRSDVFSTVIGCAGLVIVFSVLLCEIANKDIFLTKVWFELIWVAALCIMELAGAAASTAVGIDILCRPLGTLKDLNDASGQCASSRVLQGSSWMGSLILLSYFVLLAVFTLLKEKEDGTIWQCYVRKFPWTLSQSRLPGTPGPISPGDVERKASKFSKISLRRFISPSTKGPISIKAPRPRHAANDQAMQNILSYRSGLSHEYEIEHLAAINARPIGRLERAVVMEEKYQATIVQPPRPIASLDHSLYPERMRAAMAAATTSTTTHQRSGEDPNSLPPSPNPIGNWPQLNPPVRRLGLKRSKAANNNAASTRQGDLTFHDPPATPTFRTRPTGPRRPSISYGPRPAAYRQRILPKRPVDLGDSTAAG